MCLYPAVPKNQNSLRRNLNENYGHNFRNPSTWIAGRFLGYFGITQWGKDHKLSKEALL